MQAETLRKLMVFGVVGVGASVLHIAVAWVVDRLFDPSIFVANLVGFLIAFLWSYIGHYFFTFNSTKAHRLAIPRFAVTALSGYAINNGVVLACVLATGAESLWFIVLAVGIAAGVVYLLSNFWALGGKT